MKKTRSTLFILSLGGLLLVLGLWYLSIQGLLYINYCPAYLANVEESPRTEWQIASTRGCIALILVPQGNRPPGWAADYESFGPSGFDLHENPCSRIIGRFSKGEEIREMPFVGIERYWAVRVPYWFVSLVMMIPLLILIAHMIRSGTFVKPYEQIPSAHKISDAQQDGDGQPAIRPESK